jgi:hypothetical protein
MLVKLIHTPADPVRFAFLHLFTKREGMARDDGTKGTPKFEATAIIQPGGANEKRINDAIVAVAKEKYGEKEVSDGAGGKIPNWKAVLKGLDADRRGLRDGNDKRTPGGDIYDGFEGMKFITARTEKRPGVYDRDRSVLTAEDGKPYSGAYGNLNIDIWALKKQGVKPCIVAELSGAQFVDDGDAFGGGVGAAKPDDFEDLGAGEDEGSGDNGSTETADNPFD